MQVILNNTNASHHVFQQVACFEAGGKTANFLKNTATASQSDCCHYWTSFRFLMPIRFLHVSTWLLAI